jgi:multidrug efflux pump subunit AcrB
VDRGFSNAVVSHYNVRPVIDIYATPQGRDLGGVVADIHKAMQSVAHAAPAGTATVLRGQAATMASAYQQLFVGLAFAIVLIYLLIVVNFQSWLDPFVIVAALPTALAGIVWMLFATGTTLSVPALTGAIMCMGVATANSILVIAFARERMALGDDASAAAMAAGSTRFRPVLMTALAMIIGMLPMAGGDRRPRLCHLRHLAAGSHPVQPGARKSPEAFACWRKQWNITINRNRLRRRTRGSSSISAWPWLPWRRSSSPWVWG